MEAADDEAIRLEELRQIKRATLHELDKQAARYTDANVPPHIQTERQRLRDELGMTETVLRAPAGMAISQELGDSGRFLYYAEQFRQIRQEMREIAARHEERLTAFVQESLVWRMRQGFVLIVIVVVVVILAMVVIFWLGRLSDGRSLSWLLW